MPWLRDHATKTAFVRKSVSRVHARRADRGRAAGGGGAEAAGHQHHPDAPRREPHAGRTRPRRSRSTTSTCSTRSRRRARRADLGQADAARARSRSRRCASATSIGCSSAPSSAATSCGSTWRARRYVDPTLELYRARAGEDARASASRIQAYLYRTAKDVEALIPLGPAIRIVKGAYLEPPDVAYPKKADVDENFYKLCVRLMPPDAQQAGTLLHIATHDIALADRLNAWIATQQGAAVGLRVRDALRHPARAAAAAGRATASGCASSSATASTGSRGTCAGWPSARPTCGSC